ncbi:MAG: hypothetical protein GC159_13700 [Phycisphaera sp.]|nr:hypothetical protein [Phycisphaera sp.]
MACVALLIGLTWSSAVRAADDTTGGKTDDVANVEHLAIDSTGKLKPIDGPKAWELHESIQRGVAFLLESQNADGSWGSATHTKDLNIYAPVPGAHHAFRAATTALCVSALIEVGVDDDPRAVAAIERGEAWLLDHLPEVRRPSVSAIYNVWAHAYGIQALVRMLDRHSGDVSPVTRNRITAEIADQIDRLRRYQYVSGGWGYYDFDSQTQHPAGDTETSFTTATVMVALREAQDAGVQPPTKIVEHGVRAIERQRKPDNTYLYSQGFHFYPMRGINRPGGSLGRTQACNLALRVWGDGTVTDDVLAGWLDRLFLRNGWLSMGRKRPIPHESYFQVAGYFYYYGHYYGALCIDQLPPERRPIYQDYMAATLLALQEKDGSWWDYPLYNYHQPYGTAFALMSLQRCRR